MFKKQKKYLIRLILIIIALGLLAGISCTMPAESSKKNAAENIDLETGGLSKIPSQCYTGTFGELLNKSEGQVISKLYGIMYQFFHGNDNQRLYYSAGSGKGYILNNKGLNNEDIRPDVRSEGMSYGMMICLQMNLKPEFNALWNYVKEYMWHTDEDDVRYGYFSWRVNPNGTPIKIRLPDGSESVHDDPRFKNPAPDGEEYFAAALLMAWKRWGREEYRDDALKILDAMLHRETKTATEPSLLDEDTGEIVNDNITVYDMFYGSYIRFTPVSDMYSAFGPGNDEKLYKITDPSYVLPHFYHLFARWGNPDDRGTWEKIRNRGRKLLFNATNEDTGLGPDYSYTNGLPVDKPDVSGTGASYNHKNFNWDAYRIMMNAALDRKWFPTYSLTEDLVDRIVKYNTFFHGEMENRAVPYDRYYLNGDNEGTGPSDALLYTTGASSTYITFPGGYFDSWDDYYYYRDTIRKDNVEKLWDASIPGGEWRYYNGCLYMLSMLIASDNFRYKDWALDLTP